MSAPGTPGDGKKPAIKPMDTFTGTLNGAGELSDLEFEGNDNSEEEATPRKPAFPPLSKNTIISVIQLALRRRGDVHICALTGHEFRPEQMRELIARVFNAEAIRELGMQVISALLTGDRSFERTLKGALKEADNIFHRDREMELLGKFMDFVSKLSGNIPPDDEFRKRFETERNNGRRLEDHKWRRLRNALKLPKGKPGRPKKTRHGKRKSVS